MRPGLLGAARRQVRRRAGDAGFGLIEMLVAVMLIGIVTTATTSLFIQGMHTTAGMRQRQTATVLADRAMEQVRARDPQQLVSGRDATSVAAQWAAPVTGVSLADVAQVSDPSATSGAGASAPLPTSPVTTTVSNVVYSTSFFVGQCWQPRGGGGCGAAQVSTYIPFYRVVVAVTWSSARTCGAATCSSVTSSLVNASADPKFNINGLGLPGATRREVPA